ESIRPIVERVHQTLACPTREMRERQVVAHQEETARVIARHRARLEAMAIPARYSTATFDTGRATGALERAKCYVEQEYSQGGALVLAGPTGTGKSYAAIAALRAIDAGRLWYFPALCGALLDPGKRATVLHDVKVMPFLVLDDLGTEY